MNDKIERCNLTTIQKLWPHLIQPNNRVRQKLDRIPNTLNRKSGRPELSTLAYHSKEPSLLEE